MLIHWRREQLQATEIDVLDPSEDEGSVLLRDVNSGIGNSGIIAFAKRLGLRAVPPLCPTEDAIEGWLRWYGPLWVNGRTHIVVIAGIRPGQVLVYDPAPAFPTPQWRSLETWYAGSGASSRDAAMDVETVFLHGPAL